MFNKENISVCQFFITLKTVIGNVGRIFFNPGNYWLGLVWSGDSTNTISRWFVPLGATWAPGSPSSARRKFKITW